MKLLAGWGAGGSRLAPFGEDAAGQEGVGAAIVGHDAKAGRQRAVYAHTQETGAARHEVADILQALVFVGAGVDASPADGRRGNLQQAQAGGAAAFGIANVYAEGVLDSFVLPRLRFAIPSSNANSLSAHSMV